MTDKELIRQYVTAHADNRWMDASELEALLTEFAEKLQEPVGEDFESEWKRYCDSKGGGAVTMNVKDVAKHFTEWQKTQDQQTIELAEEHAMLAGMMQEREKMMKDAIECNYRKARLASGHYLSDLTMADVSELNEVADRLQLRDRDKVKVIIIKE